MLTLFAALAVSQMVAPPEEMAGQLYGAIWYDLRSNAMIGNGNELAARWANAGGDSANPPRHQIRDLLCSGGGTRLRCRFNLLRDGGVVSYLGEPAPDRLACRVTFRRARTEVLWSIPRLPPGPRGGHSRITIRCEAVP